MLHLVLRLPLISAVQLHVCESLLITNLVLNLLLPDSKPVPEPPRNKFMEIDSPIMPQSLCPWTTASEDVGRTFNGSQKSRPGAPRGYVLPEPALIANHKDESSRQSYLKTYLKLRDILVYCLMTFGPIPCLKSPSDWRSMLALELHGVKQDGRQAQMRNKIRDDIAMAASKLGRAGLVCTFSYFTILTLTVYCSRLTLQISRILCLVGRVKNSMGQSPMKSLARF